MKTPVIKLSANERKLFSDFMDEDVGEELDFNRLIPVVEKISHTPTGKWLSEGSNLCAEIMYQLQTLSITNIHFAVVKFLQWYNSQNQQP